MFPPVKTICARFSTIRILARTQKRVSFSEQMSYLPLVYSSLLYQTTSIPTVPVPDVAILTTAIHHSYTDHSYTGSRTLLYLPSLYRFENTAAFVAVMYGSIDCMSSCLSLVQPSNHNNIWHLFFDKNYMFFGVRTTPYSVLMVLHSWQESMSY